jgi:hypothetical protein
MKRTTKHGKGAAKPAQQPAFKTPAQELEEFGAKVLGMKYGEFIWRNLNAYPVREIGMLIGTAIPIEEFSAAFREAKTKLPELWPEYMRLLRLNPDELKAYSYKVAFNGSWEYRFNDAFYAARDLLRPGVGAPRKQAVRDALIYSLYKQGTKKTDQQVATILEHKHGIKMSRQAVRRAYDREEERRTLQAAKLNSR